MTPLEIVKEYFPNESAETHEHILWNETGWPSFFKAEDGKISNELSLRNQLKELAMKANPKTPIELVKKYFPNASDKEADSVLWCCSGWPCAIPTDDKTSIQQAIEIQLKEMAEKANGCHLKALTIADEEMWEGYLHGKEVEKLAKQKVVFGLKNQGHISTIEKMLSENKSWDEIGKAINWCPDTAKEHYQFFLESKETGLFEARMYVIECPDCNKTNGSGFESSNHPIDKNDAALHQPCKWCNQGPMIIRYADESDESI